MIPTLEAITITQVEVLYAYLTRLVSSLTTSAIRLSNLTRESTTILKILRTDFVNHGNLRDLRLNFMAQ
jgi:hypothetical protein